MTAGAMTTNDTIPRSGLSRRDFFADVVARLRGKLPAGLAAFRVAGTTNLLKIYYANERIHYEVWTNGALGLIEIGLHFEDGPLSTAAYLAHFDRHIVELKHELGPQVELERWTMSWGHLFELMPLSRLDTRVVDRTATRLAQLIATLQPLVEAAAVAPERVAEAPKTGRPWRASRHEVGLSGYRLFRPLLFRLDPERAHERVLGGLNLVSRSPALLAATRRLYHFDDPRLAVRLFDRTLSSPLGVAAGLDKNGVAVPAFDALGFGFVEVGTVTPRPQVGNARPRLFRLPEDEALINRLGFPSDGVEEVAHNLAQVANDYVLGLNVGPNRERVAQADEECGAIIARLWTLNSAYFVVNVSSPNTAQLRDLQGREALHRLLSGVLANRPSSTGVPPILVKIAPDLSDQELDDVLQVVTDLTIPGVVATNTTTSRPVGLHGRRRTETGGLSGRPLASLADRIIRRIYRQTAGELVIIAAGGVFSGHDVLAKIRAGATAVQVYTGMIYGGPAMAKRAKQEMAAFLDRNGVASVMELRGVDEEGRGGRVARGL
jgi:dihydroorotate dehydrogenase